MRRRRLAATAGRYGLCFAAVSAVIFVCFRVIPVNATTVALFLLLVVLGIATTWGLGEAFFTSIIAVLGFNFFFLPPVGTLTIADPENWVALFVFLVTAVIVSQLSSLAKRRMAEAVAGRNEIARLYELGRAMLLDETSDAVRGSVTRIGQILQVKNIAFFDAAASQLYGSVGDSGISESDLAQVAQTGERVTKADCAVIPVRLGSHIVGSLAIQGGDLSSGARESAASLLAINYERARALERAAAAEVARRNEEFKSALLDGFAHDLKTPLTAIRACATRLITIPPRSEEVHRELLTIIDQESERLQKSISEAIQLARVESGATQLNRSPISAADLVQAAIAGIRDEDGQRYSVEIPAGIVLDADGDLMVRALLQILENARKYAPPDSAVQIEAHLANGLATISVSDRGPGLRQDEIERIFEKYYRGRSATAGIEGTGMGLAIAKAIVEAHGGKIRAANRPGGGATISFSVPLTPAAP